MSIIKGVVLEKHNSIAVILTAEGEFKKIQVQGTFEIGDEIQGKEYKVNRFLTKRMVSSVAIAATFLLAILVPNLYDINKSSPGTQNSSSNAMQNTVVAYVKVDINPSLQLGLNEQLLVTETEALNVDGKEVLAQGSLKGMTVPEAMESVTEWSYQLGYLKKDKENVVNLTYISKEEKESKKIDTEKLEKDIKSKVKKVMENKNLDGEVKEFKEIKFEAKPNKQEGKQKQQEQKEKKIESQKGKAEESKQVENINKNNSGGNGQDKNSNGKGNGQNKASESKESNNINSGKKEHSNNPNKDIENNYGKENKNNKANKNDMKEQKSETKGKSSKQEFEVDINDNVGLYIPWYRVLELG